MREIDLLLKATYRLREILSHRPLQGAPRVWSVMPPFIGWQFLTFLPETAEFGWLAMNWFIHFCMVLLILTSQGFSPPGGKVSSVYSQSSTASFPSWSVRFEILLKINLLTYKTLREKQPVYLHCMLAAHWGQTVIIVCQSIGSRPILVLELFPPVPPSLWNDLPLSVRSSILVATFNKYLKTHPFDLELSPIDTVTPHGLLMLRNYFLGFAAEHWFGWCATEPSFAGDIGAIEVWSIDWLIDWLKFFSAIFQWVLANRLASLWRILCSRLFDRWAVFCRQRHLINKDLTQEVVPGLSRGLLLVVLRGTKFLQYWMIVSVSTFTASSIVADSPKVFDVYDTSGFHSLIDRFQDGHSVYFLVKPSQIDLCAHDSSHGSAPQPLAVCSLLISRPEISSWYQNWPVITLSDALCGFLSPKHGIWRVKDSLNRVGTPLSFQFALRTPADSMQHHLCFPAKRFSLNLCKTADFQQY